LHDSAVAILDPDGQPLFAEANERFLQHKRAYQAPPDDLLRVPKLLDDLCDPEAELTVAVSWSDDMLRKLTFASLAGLQTATVTSAADDLSWPMPAPELFLTGLRNSVSQAGLAARHARRGGPPVTVRRYDHHLAHAAHAAITSPFDDCDVAVIDGYGETRATSFFRFTDGRLFAVDGQPGSSVTAGAPASLGHFYAQVCAACGFDALVGEEWKVMGLAAYGRPTPELDALLRPALRVCGLGLEPGASPSDQLRRLTALRGIARQPGQPPEIAADLAATGQHVFEDVVVELLRALHDAAPSDRLALAGGCALNSSCNGGIVGRTPFGALHVPSAPADDGCALGAALLAFAEDHPGRRPPPTVASAYLGSSMAGDTVDQLHRFGGLAVERLHDSEMTVVVSGLLADGRIVGWVQGRAEFGPRALGHRSILADPRRPEMKDRLNAIVKFREAFRPFAPSVLDERGAEYFERYQTSRYMERTLRFRQERCDRVPAVVHVDGTGRLQSVRREWTPRFYDLIAAFDRRTGVPMLLNTSLNVMGKPIVHAIEDALGVFLTSGIDVLVIDDALIRKPTPTTTP
jgi:carbamoyltransferase